MSAVDDAREFEPEVQSVSQARRFLREALRELQSDEDGADLADTVLLAANEIATNAVLHARTTFNVHVVIDVDSVCVEVTDENSRMPQPCLTPADATSGRGLTLVDGTGLQWGMQRHPGGKTVWVRAERSHA